MSIINHLCPKCRNTVIKETVVKEYAFVCWFCDENFYPMEVIKVERELSHGAIRRELRKRLGQFIKTAGIQAQIKILQKAFCEYEDFCGRQKLKIYSSSGLSKFLGSVNDWKIFFEQITDYRRTATIGG